MWAICVRAWVEVVGSVMEFISFQSQWNVRNFLAPPCAKSGKLAVPRMNSLAKYLAVQYIRRYIAEFNEIECCSSQYSGKNWVTLTNEANRGGSAVPYDKAVALAACRQPGGCRRIPYIGSERKNSVRKTGERYKHREEKSGSVALRPVEIPPLYRIWRIPTAYSCTSMGTLSCAKYPYGYWYQNAQHKNECTCY